ncbi:MAG: quinone-dependent dihydroorotate dehydrogenase [Minisyncoccia bacterium]
MLYKNILKPVLFLFDPELVHNLFISMGEFLGRFSFTRYLVSLAYGYRGKDISKTVDGVLYKTPFILSAGFDYNGRLTQILPAISFGGVEIGSVTARACEGNPKPRLMRLVKSKSILVNKGLRNDGVDAIIKRLQSKPKQDGFVIGVSIARTNDKQSSTTDLGIQDYCYSFRRLNEENVGDFYTINISCPNAFGGEQFTTPELLEKLLVEIKKIPSKKPVYVKVPINISWEQMEKLVDIVVSLNFSGIVVGNLNKKYEALDYRDEAPMEYRGGLSGKPCFDLSNEHIKNIKHKYPTGFTIVGCGGVMSPDDAQAKFKYGSDLIQLISGIIFEGPSLVKKMAKRYSQMQ